MDAFISTFNYYIVGFNNIRLEFNDQVKNNRSQIAMQYLPVHKTLLICSYSIKLYISHLDFMAIRQKRKKIQTFISIKIFVSLREKFLQNMQARKLV